MNQIKWLQKKLKHPLLIQICQQPSDLLIEWWLHLLVHQFVKRTNTAVANPHKIFICNTCFTIGIDPLSLVAGEVLTSSQTRRQSQEDKLKAYWCRQRFILLSRCSFTATVFHWLLQHTGADMTAWALRDFLKSQTHVWEQRWRNILLWCGNLTLERKHFLFNSWIQNIFHRGSGSETSFVLKRGSWSV